MMRVYVTDFGNVRLPDDFPMSKFTKRGRPDRRYKIAASLVEFEASIKEAAYQRWVAGQTVEGLRTMSWAAWQKPSKS